MKITFEEGAIVIGSLLDAPILPIYSDPTNIDGDEDSFDDSNDPNPLQFNQKYNRDAVYEYAQKWGEKNNDTSKYNSEFPPASIFSNNDCANFVSQCIYTGGFPTSEKWYYEKRKSEINDLDNTFIPDKIVSILADKYGSNNDYVKPGWRCSTSWGKAYLQCSYFSDLYPRNVIKIDNFNILNESFYNCNNIQKGDLLYFAKANKVCHASIISSIEGNTIKYAAHTNDHFDNSLVNFKLEYDYIVIVKMEDALPCGKGYYYH